MVSEPTRDNNILDLFLTNNPTLVNNVSIVPGISDQETVIAVVKLRPTIQKMKPRTVHIYSKADWEGMRHDIQKFQSSFLSTCEGKSTEKLWQEFKGDIDKIVDTYVPTKTLSKKTLPWVTQEIRREMIQWDHLYQVQKNTGKEEDRQKFTKFKYEADCMIKTSHNSYLDNVVGIIDDSDPIENSRPNTKKLFSYLKNCRQDSQGSAHLKENGQVCTDNVKKANLLNKQFQSVFTSMSPLKLNHLCQKICKTFTMRVTTARICHNHLMTPETNIQICQT